MGGRVFLCPDPSPPPFPPIVIHPRTARPPAAIHPVWILQRDCPGNRPSALQRGGETGGPGFRAVSRSTMEQPFPPTAAETGGGKPRRGELAFRRGEYQPPFRLKGSRLVSFKGVSSRHVATDTVFTPGPPVSRKKPSRCVVHDTRPSLTAARPGAQTIGSGPKGEGRSRGMWQSMAEELQAPSGLCGFCSLWFPQFLAELLQVRSDIVLWLRGSLCRARHVATDLRHPPDFPEERSIRRISPESRLTPYLHSGP